MAFDPFKAYQAGQDEEDRIETRRSDKAKAFREYVDAKVKNGETVDPYELDRMRMTMAGGDPYLASYIPAGSALNEMANRANERSRLSKLKINVDMADQRDLERTYVQKIVDANWDKDESQMAEIFGAAFGQDGVRIYDQYKPELSGMLNEATGKKYYQLSQNPAAKMVREESDLYRFFPAEMRNPKTAAILKSMAADNVRQRSIDNVDEASKVLKNTPDFVLRDPEMQKWWTDFAGPALPGGQKFLERGLAGMSTQVASEQQAKIIDIASKDSYFAYASQSGDEEAIFAATRSIMVQAGMPAPQSPSDPRYQQVRQDLNLVSRTASILTYNKREADLRTVAIEEAEALQKAAGKRVEALMSGAFSGSQYSNGKSGKNKGVDERITATLNLIGTDSTFFPSEENLQAAINFIKAEFDADKQNFDPAAAAGKFMAEGDIDTKAQWVDRRATAVLETEYGVKPGENFTVWSDKRQTNLHQIMLDTFDTVSKPTANQQEYEAILNNKAIVVQRIRSELSNIRSVVNTLNNDPAKRATVLNYDYNQSLLMLQSLENQLSSLEQLNPTPPAVPEQHSQVQPAPQPSEYYTSDMYARPDDSRFERGMKHLGAGTANTIIGASKFMEAIDPVNVGKRLGNYLFTPMNQEQAGQPVVSYHSTDSETTSTVNGSFRAPSNTASRLDTYLDVIADVESGGDPFARANTSSATGLLQFTQGTWNEMVKRYGARHGITEQDILNPAAQRIMGGYLTMENAEQLMRQTGKEPSEKDLYLAHFLGPSRAATVINNQGSNLLAANLFPDAARANRSIFYKDGVPVTIEQLYKKLGGKVTRRMEKEYEEMNYNENGEREV